MELFAALNSERPIVFRCVAASLSSSLSPSGPAAALSSAGAFNMLSNFSYEVDVREAEATVAADRVRELTLTLTLTHTLTLTLPQP